MDAANAKAKRRKFQRKRPYATPDQVMQYIIDYKKVTARELRMHFPGRQARTAAEKLVRFQFARMVGAHYVVGSMKHWSERPWNHK